MMKNIAVNVTVTINSISYYKKILKTLSSSDINYTTDLILSVDGYLTMYSEDDNFFRVNSIKDNLDGYERMLFIYQTMG